ncbi:MAG: hypothetical protein NZ739_03185 [Verrucomicrobiae bacterium]|nr:hypothetical protein [Verrucomicrobiae bacterium]MCX7721918.1 hypothetical protein [Verrucomicrobiae bacterium]MDW7979589.1 hypothetical protein [Verrucomicrobiales bacterium]
MSLNPVEVVPLPGPGGQMLPRRFRGRTGWVDVAEIIDRWYQGKGDPEWPPADYFKVLGADQRVYLLKHELDSDKWYLAREW